LNRHQVYQMISINARVVINIKQTFVEKGRENVFVTIASTN